MLISDPAFAAQLHTRTARSRASTIPAACFARIEARRPDVHALWFHHLREDRWLPGDGVAFVRVAPTPMGFGFGAVDPGTPEAVLDRGGSRRAARARRRAMRLAELAAVARLDLGEVLRSRWLLLCVLLYAVLGGVFVLVGLRESSVLGFTGLGRVLFSLCHALVLLLPLLALLGTVQTVNRARDDGSLELYLSHPIGRGAFLAGVTGVRLAALALPLALVMGAVALAGSAGGPGDSVVLPRARARRLRRAARRLRRRGLATSVLVRNPARAMTLVFLIWIASVTLLDFAGIALLLQWRVSPQAVFVLAAAQPGAGRAHGAALVGRADARDARPGRLLPREPPRRERALRARPRVAIAGGSRRLAGGVERISPRRRRLAATRRTG